MQNSINPQIPEKDESNNFRSAVLTVDDGICKVAESRVFIIGFQLEHVDSTDQLWFNPRDSVVPAKLSYVAVSPSSVKTSIIWCSARAHLFHQSTLKTVFETPRKKSTSWKTDWIDFKIEWLVEWCGDDVVLEVSIVCSSADDGVGAEEFTATSRRVFHVGCFGEVLRLEDIKVLPLEFKY